MSTKEEIQLSINSRLSTSPTLIEGGWVQDIVGSVSYEIANILDTMIAPVLDNAFVSTADEEHLTIRGEELGIYRKEAAYSIVYAKITGAAPNFELSTEIRAKTQQGVIFRNYETSYTNSSGEALIKMICLEKGPIGNIKAGELNEFVSLYAGLTVAKITNPEFGYDGFEREDIEDYRLRILEYLKEDACNSNIQDYIMWAKSVSGVKNVVVKDATFAGAGNVYVYVSALNYAEVSEDLLKKVQAKIEEEQIINAKVSVYPLQYLPVNISANITLNENGNILYIKSELSSKVENYLNNLSGKVVSYLYISNLMFEIEGIQDVSSYLLNGAATGVSVGDFEVPVLGEIQLIVDEEI